ncbi:MAG: RNA polymerase sigma-I factor [Clostridia bacterium]|uniref:RNA polymerase sigma factor SigI n=1 Tax=Desulforamulus aeronauticus DSM 10349 TaxID=1121421 RepID=A0A1M6X7F0_9FIRM|nr:RNA polymerase sigma-I factor [Desulforamulus aeronauticus]MDA8210553.1 RNA polymerase sigma-I factor [Clostridia bacterium]SHL01846.1 RNA polymerase sigma factor [Desulforamulus aeronauticus DSM 10349]
MRDQPIEELLLLAQKGDLRSRETIIEENRDFIARVSSKICNRYLTWNNDDELSIALIAFNEAIDGYDPREGMAFPTFARRVIHHRLVDYFRKEAKHRHIPLLTEEADEEFSTYDVEYAYQQYHEQQQQENFEAVMEHYIAELTHYGVTLDDLVKVSPKHRDSKETLVRVARALSGERALLETLTKQKLLPIKELELLTGVKRKVLERGRKYLIALTLIFSNPSFYALKSFTDIPD